MTHFIRTALSLFALALIPTASAGSLHALQAPTSGTVSVTQQGGKSVLSFKNLKTEVGPDLQVWLYQDAAPQKGAKDSDIAKGKYLKVGDLKKFSGDVSITLPAGTRVNDFKSVVIWCAQVMTAFGAGDLK